MRRKDWSADVDGEEKYIMRFSSSGVQPVEEKLQWLVGRVGLCFNEDVHSGDVLLLLGYNEENSRLVLNRCHSTRVSSCVNLCSFPII